MSDELVCVATFDKVHEAQLCKSQLEGAGIRAVLENEFALNANWLLSNALGGIRLHVTPENREAALQVLAQGRQLFHLAEGENMDQVSSPSDSVSDSDERARSQEAVDDENEEPWESEREAHARRALMFAVTGMVIFPLQLFTAWILWEVATMPGRLRPLYRFYFFGASMVALAYLGVMATVVLAGVLNL
jgi:hypothetical protein